MTTEGGKPGVVWISMSPQFIRVPFLTRPVCDRWDHVVRGKSWHHCQNILKRKREWGLGLEEEFAHRCQELGKVFVYTTSYSWFSTFSSHWNQELSEVLTELSVTFTKTLMLTVRPRLSSSNQFEKRQFRWDVDKSPEVIFPVDFPSIIVYTRKSICEYATCLSKTVVRAPWVRMYLQEK